MSVTSTRMRGLLRALSIGFAVLLVVRVVGAAAEARPPSPVMHAALASFGALWIGLRFFRWQFLLRRFGVRRPIRAELVRYLRWLPGAATPLQLGEFGRALERTGPGDGDAPRESASALSAFVAARLLDVAAVSGAALAMDSGAAALGGPVLGAAVLGATVLGWAMLAALGPARHGFRLLSRPRELGWAIAGTLAAWAPVWSAGVLLGGSSPGLAYRFVFQGPAIAAGGPDAWAWIYLAGVPVVAGLWFLVRASRPPAARSASEHFDRIADEYLDQWTPHIWSHLIARKVGLMEARLKAGARGLDLGCGAGRQVLAMNARGFRTIGVDPALELVRLGREAGAPCLAASGFALPFPADSFDFVFTVGVLHHLPGPAAQERTVREIRRVLKPGGVLLVHETNPRNPLFRFYMGYAFPLLKTIDEGTEWWIPDTRWTGTDGFEVEGVDYFTFIPDFLPRGIMRPFLAVEAALERSGLRRFSVHYMATVRKALA